MRRLIKKVTGLDVTDTAATVVVIIFALTIAVGFLLVLSAFIYAIETGRMPIDSEVSTQFWRLIVLVLISLGPLITAAIQKQYSDVKHRETQNKITVLSEKMEDGGADIIAHKTANLVAEQVADLKATTEAEAQPYTGPDRRRNNE